MKTSGIFQAVSQATLLDADFVQNEDVLMKRIKIHNRAHVLGIQYAMLLLMACTHRECIRVVALRVAACRLPNFVHIAHLDPKVISEIGNAVDHLAVKSSDKAFIVIRRVAIVTLFEFRHGEHVRRVLDAMATLEIVNANDVFPEWLICQVRIVRISRRKR